MARIVLIFLIVFWVTMNVLLWRAEYGRPDSAGTAVPAMVIWQKILTAPDSSSLSIFHHGKKIGFCHWMTSVGQELSKATEENIPEGMIGHVSSYRVQIEGNLALTDFANRVRFDAVLRLSTNQAWQEFTLRVNLRPVVWELHSVAAEQRARFRMEEDENVSERIFKFSEFENPEALVQEFGGPMISTLWRGLALPTGRQTNSSVALGLKWTGRQDSLTIAHSSVRVYRLSARLLERYEVLIFISRVGEILRVELPDEIVLMNDQMTNF